MRAAGLCPRLEHRSRTYSQYVYVPHAPGLLNISLSSRLPPTSHARRDSERCDSNRPSRMSSHRAARFPSTIAGSPRAVRAACPCQLLSLSLSPLSHRARLRSCSPSRRHCQRGGLLERQPSENNEGVRRPEILSAVTSAVDDQASSLVCSQVGGVLYAVPMEAGVVSRLRIPAPWRPRRRPGRGSVPVAAEEIVLWPPGRGRLTLGWVNRHPGGTGRRRRARRRAGRACRAQEIYFVLLLHSLVLCATDGRLDSHSPAHPLLGGIQRTASRAPAPGCWISTPETENRACGTRADSPAKRSDGLDS